MPEKEYIERDYAVYLVEYFGSMLTWSKEDILSEIKRKLKEETAADVAEVKHGEWIKLQNGWECRCSLCGAPAMYHIDSTPSNYCQSCGAKMDGKENG